MLQEKLTQPDSKLWHFKISQLHQAIILVLSCGVASVLYAAEDTSNTSVPTEDKDVKQLESVVVVGNRGGIRTVTESPAPVDIISGEQLLKQGNSVALQDILAKLIPSFKVDTIKSWTNSYSAVARSAGLRSFGGGHTLVLVNGKRRHVGAQYVTNGSIIEGYQAADLNLIPISAIARIEVLRDGAAAQYGSDAISGVINIVLKSTDHGGSLTSTYGGRAHYSDHEKQNGETYQTNGDFGLPLGQEGFIHFAYDYKNQDAVTRAAAASGQFYSTINGQPDPRETTIDRWNYRAGIPSVEALNLAYNAELPLTDQAILYSNSTAGWRKAVTGLGFRRANSIYIVDEIYPDGVAPIMKLDESDFQTVWGIKGDQLWGWSWDISTSYGKNILDTTTTDNINASLGTNSPTNFGLQKYEAYQWVNNLDFKKSFDIGLGVNPLSVAWGLDYRKEGWSIKATDALAYADGGYVFNSGDNAGTKANVGLIGVALVQPDDEADIDRSNTAAYLDLGLDATQNWFVGLAGRFEHYDDSSGNTFNGKLTSRYAITPNLAVRGTVSSGFVAPSLVQQGYGTTTVGYGPDVNGIYANRKSKLVRPDATLAQALGAEELKPTKSKNYSLGLTFSPFDKFNIAIDAYRIDLKDRIAQTSALSGSGVSAILAANGFSDIQTVQYFANLFDTQTTGVDVVIDYTQQLQNYGRLRWNLGFNYNETKITGIADNPEELQGINVNRVGRAAIGAVTVANPKTKLTLGTNWQYQKFDINTRLSRYGSVISRGATAATDSYYGAKWIVDVDATYHLTDNLSVTLGADNLFNTYPDETTSAVILASGDISGGSKYPNISPFGSYGGYYYGRISYRF
ncbi:TonB-dependent receptor [Acinetobacter qingfengensis]|uniref:Uncharacterized protein n=1 Tax=Acinetobacter qingfengensis TaxID=1262585 RepID=A0A1E7R401_9GAMM|nr:TonB-dependent receptor [Acinetobacter qingfengensis]KAA8733731.1 TonB-dependent receptor [Acinetobacter qingfengensis]OEY94045.1 hypothetical protein BJI46_13655 [Acinetobacter qingfengensis]